jgi:hypothetical protein
MRDRERIYRVTTKLMILWGYVPDERFGQMLENYVYPARIVHHKAVSIIDWHMEDDVFEKKLDRAIELMKSRKREVEK